MIIDFNEQKNKIFFKRNYFVKKNNKNLILTNRTNEKIVYQDVLIFLKKEILELVKSQNIIDIGTPSFLNINFSLKILMIYFYFKIF